MSNIIVVKQPKTKSKQIIMDCLRRVIKLAIRREFTLCAIVLVGVDGKYHIDRIGPVNMDQRDELLTAVENLHEDVYTALDKS